ncbi:MAG: methyltransferase domain-containing protein [Acidobacteriota bacterium]
MRIDFSKRSTEPEIIDDPNRLSHAEWMVTLRELRMVNRWLGGTSAILGALKPLVQEIAQREEGKKAVEVVDFGSGSADIAAALVRWARRKGYPIRVLAVDFNSLVCEIAQQQSRRFPEITILQGDVRKPPLREVGCDLVLCSAFLHHFTNQEISKILGDLRLRTRVGILISDLHRHPLAYFGIRLFLALFSRSEAVRRDGPLSVLKGFGRHDIRTILDSAAIAQSKVKWCWAFRYVVFIPAAPSCHSVLATGRIANW